MEHRCFLLDGGRLTKLDFPLCLFGGAIALGRSNYHPLLFQSVQCSRQCLRVHIHDSPKSIESESRKLLFFYSFHHFAVPITQTAKLLNSAALVVIQVELFKVSLLP